MSLRRKLFLLLGGIMGIFGLGLVWLWRLDGMQFREAEQRRVQERAKAFDRFLGHWGMPLETFVIDHSCLDDAVRALRQDDHAWAEEHLGDGVSTMYDVHALWLYRPDGSLFHSRNQLYTTDLAEVPVERTNFGRLFSAKKTQHFFIKVPVGTMEIWAATVHPSRDSGRTGAVQGYLFAGRLWNNAELDDMSVFSGNTVSLVDSRSNPDHLQAPAGSVVFTRDLPGWDGTPVSQIRVQHDAPLVEQVLTLRRRLWIWALAFATVLLAVLAIALRRWVWGPLRELSRSLRSEKVESLDRYSRDRSEVGELAQVIRSFFSQREALLKEVCERENAEKALRESEDQLRHSQKMEAVGRLAGGVAHDFNNLLTAIIGYGGLLQVRYKIEDVEQILKAGDQAASLTRQLLAFSRKQVLHPRVLDLNRLVREMTPLLRRLIGEQIELQVTATASQSLIKADPTQIEQVLLNLVVNGRDAMPRGGCINVSTANRSLKQETHEHGATLLPGNYVTLAVADDGCGMDAATRERIFEPFFTTKPSGQGTGLGLATVYGIVQQSGGTITLSSEPGDGTTFYIYLPLTEAPLEDPVRTEAPEPKHHGQGETILVVEDEVAVRELVCSVLKECGYTVHCAADCDEARALANKHRGEIRLLLTDVVLPKMSGPELAMELRSEHPEMDVVFMSGYASDPFMEEELLQAGGGVLEKPFTAGVLVQKVQETLSGTAQQVG